MHVRTGFALTEGMISQEISGCRSLSYNNSFWDTSSEDDPDFDDKSAIAPDKVALRPGNTASFANYTSYDKGINGIMVDVAGLPPVVEPLDPDHYFQFKVGNDDDPANWSDIEAEDKPTVDVREGQGIFASHRVTLIWTDYQADQHGVRIAGIGKQWLQVTVLANGNTGLAEPDVFYYGNAIGESGNSATDARVNAIDVVLARNNPRNLMDEVPRDFRYDYNRDRRVNATDMLLARENQTHLLNSLKLISVPGVKDEARMTNDETEALPPSPLVLDWLYEYEHCNGPARSSHGGGPIEEEAVEALLASCWS